MRTPDSRKTAKKRQTEQRVVEEMIALYCKKQHGTRTADGLCRDCQTLLDYARARSARCPFMEQKTFCSNCPVHCYQPAMREQIRTVMRFSGPRMLFYHPWMALWHLISSGLEKRKNRKKD